MQSLSKESVTRLIIDESGAGQRVDNFLFRLMKGVPKSHVYRVIRSGEVRVNGKRIDQTRRLELGDELRVPPVRVATPQAGAPGAGRPRGDAPPVLWEDDAILAIDKPAGMAVHGGSGVSFGVIELLRSLRPELAFLELVHRLDRDTSGILLLAKKRRALTGLHDMIRAGQPDKRYLLLVQGRWPNDRQHVKLKLHKYLTAEGERRVAVDPDGQASHTVFTVQERFADASLLEAELRTGRTHQIRVHAAASGFPILGDDKYGDFALNRALVRQGHKRMFLHAARLGFDHPLDGQRITLEAPLPAELQTWLDSLKASRDNPGHG